MLNTLEPSAFPIAIPLFPLRADTTLVANSGRGSSKNKVKKN